MTMAVPSNHSANHTVSLTEPSAQISSIPHPTFPSNALHFLNNLRDTRPIQPAPPSAAATAPTLRIAIIGAGIAGLSTALSISLSCPQHKLTIYERAPTFQEIGAGIQVPPNATRHLLSWGLGPHLSECVTEPEAILIRRWQDGKVIGRTGLVPEHRREFGGPYWVVHRADYHGGLLARVREVGVEVVGGKGVVGYEVLGGEGGREGEEVRVKFEDGTSVAADLVVAADGLKSLARTMVLGEEEAKKVLPYATGNAAYRATVEVERMREDEDTRKLVERPNQNLWIGGGRHIMSYLIGGEGVEGTSRRVFNIVFSHPEGTDPSTWRKEDALGQMKAEIEGWDPMLVKVLGMVEEGKVMKWPLMTGGKVDKWLHESSRLVILGDAAHPMVPYMSQGAAMAVEDAAALGFVLGEVKGKGQEELERALKAFEKVRSLRSGQMQEASLLNGMMWHFEDGPLQQARDEAMRPEVEGRPFSHSPNSWSDPACAMWTYGYDAVFEMKRAWKESESGKVS